MNGDLGAILIPVVGLVSLALGIELGISFAKINLFKVTNAIEASFFVLLNRRHNLSDDEIKKTYLDAIHIAAEILNEKKT